MNSELKKPKGDGRPRRVIKALRNWNQELSPEDREEKYCKMASEPLVFYRGSNQLFWDSFSRHKRLQNFGSDQTKTWLQGNLHAYNYGSFGNADEEIVYNLNDFDEVIEADYQYDIWRMVVSIVIIARQNNDIPKGQLKKVVDVFSRTYLDTLISYCDQKRAKNPCSTRIDTYGNLARLLEGVGKQYSRKLMLDHWAPVDGGERRFNLEEEDKLRDATREQREVIEKALAAYREASDNGPTTGDNHFEIKDVARRLGAGTGSLGTPRFYVLVKTGKIDNLDQYRILDVKQQFRPTPYDYLGREFKKEYDKEYGDNDARRHAIGYRALICNPDPYLGWVHLNPIGVDHGGKDKDASGYYSVRERSPFKEAFPGEVLDTRTAFSEMAEQWAEVLATGHAYANQALPHLVYDLTRKRKDKKAFLKQVRKIAFSYADQVQEDWECFKKALELKSGECGEPAFDPPSYRNMLPRPKRACKAGLDT